MQRQTKSENSKKTEKTERSGQPEALRGSLPLLAMLDAADAFEAQQLSGTHTRELAGAIGNQAMLGMLGENTDDAVQVKAVSAILDAPVPEFLDGVPVNDVLPEPAFAAAAVPEFTKSASEAVSVTAAAQLAIGLWQ